jgi:hypothetical protein
MRARSRGTLRRVDGGARADTGGERVLVAVAGLCAAALLTALAWPLLRGEIYLDSDLQYFYVPVRDFYQRALREGTEYLWYPYEFAGFYLHGEGQATLTHPLNQLSYRWLPFTLAYGLELLRSYALALAGGYFFFRRYALPSGAALFGATFFAFSSFHVLHYMHPNVVAASAHLPWLLIALDVMARGATPRRRALAAPLYALVTASQLLLGHPQIVWLCLVVEGFYALALWRGGAGAGLLARAALAKGLGAAAAAIQLIPTWETLQNSLRLVSNADFAATFALHPLDLGQLLQPYLLSERVVEDSTTEFGLYAGAFGIVALVWLALARRLPAPRRALAHGALALAALGALLAQGGLQPLLSALPVVGLFRAPCRYLLWIHLAVSVAVALVFAELCARGERKAGRAQRFALLGIPLASAALAAGWLVLAPGATQGIPPALAGVALLATAGVLTFGAARGVPGAAALLIVVACADLGVYGATYVAAREPRPARIDDVRAGLEVLPGSTRYRLTDGPKLEMMAGVRYLWGYVALWPAKRLPIFPGNLDGEQLGFEHERVWDAALRVSSVLAPQWAPLSRARLLAHAQVSDDLTRDLAVVDVETTALVEREVALDDARPGSAHIVRETPGELRITTRAPGRQLLVVSESFHQGWRAWVDGAPAELLRVYGDYMGVPVPAGNHEVRLHFEPQSYALGARVSTAALAAVVAWAAAVSLRSRRGGLAALEVGDEAA